IAYGRCCIDRATRRQGESMKLLLVEDDRGVRALVRAILEPHGHSLSEAPTCADARAQAGEEVFDAMILDVQLPDGNGFDLLRELRDGGITMPVLMLTSLDGTAEVIRGLDAGADDYLTKPFEAGVLAARVRALLRRGTNSQQQQQEISRGDLKVDRLTRKVEVGGKKMRLTPKEYMLLEHLLLNAGRTVARAELLERVWNLTFDPGSNVVDAHLARLRGKLQKAGVTDLITTIRGGGFRVDAP
ncbi:MAG TPA: response regulator transcription factor, partial [Longimicrobiaceae bacterium]|nr:response regulator transcription factor [Longimicrobiaceae bacterium]